MTAPSIVACLSAVSADVGAIAKGDTNREQGYGYRSLDAVLVAVAPALRRHGVVVAPVVESAEYVPVEVGRNSVKMTSCRLRVAYRFVGPAGDDLTATVVAEGMDTGDKATGKALSSAYKAALLQVLSLPVQDADEITPAQLRAMMTLFTEAGYRDRGDRLKFASAVLGREVESSKELSVSEAGEVIDALQLGLADGHEEAQP
jgi:hypothetical protein